MGRSIFLPIFLACISGVVSGQRNDNKEAAAKANNIFSFALQKELSQNGLINTFFSPFSLSAVLAMAYLGADGQTAKALEDVLRFDIIKDASVSKDSKSVHETYKEILGLLNSGGRDFTLRTANNMYPAKGFELLPEFSAGMLNYYGVTPQPLDFSDPRAVNVINKWVATKTSDKIQNLFDSGSLNPDTKLVLISAIYFKGIWKTQFNPQDTTIMDFHINNNQKKPVEMMQVTADFKYFYDSQRRLQVLELPYSNDQLSMFIILPDEVDWLSRLEVFRAEDFNLMKSKMMLRQVKVAIPKFKLETKYSLERELRRLGLGSLFDANRCGLHGIGREPLTVTDLYHKAVIEIDEVGTKAAAASGSAITPLTVGGNPKFVANRPFFFFFTKTRNTKDATLFFKETSSPILFTGIIVDPAPETEAQNAFTATEMNQPDPEANPVNTDVNEHTSPGSDLQRNVRSTFKPLCHLQRPCNERTMPVIFPGPTRVPMFLMNKTQLRNPQQNRPESSFVDKLGPNLPQDFRPIS